MDKNTIQNLIKELIEKLGVKTNKISVSEEGPTNTWYSVEVSEPHFFISRDREALHALNHVVRRILEVKSASDSPEDQPGIMIDINGVQRKRVDDVKALAHMMSERARYFKSSIEVDPMSAFERRIVHEFLANASDLKTESVGFGPTRRVVIKYVPPSSI